MTPGNYKNAWLGREDSNLRMVESKSTALPLGDAPTRGMRRAALSGVRTIMRGSAGCNRLAAVFPLRAGKANLAAASEDMALAKGAAFSGALSVALASLNPVPRLSAISYLSEVVECVSQSPRKWRCTVQARLVGGLARQDP